MFETHGSTVLTGPTETETIPTSALVSLSQYLNLGHCSVQLDNLPMGIELRPILGPAQLLLLASLSERSYLTIMLGPATRMSEIIAIIGQREVTVCA
jgi:hypothetical protein